MRTGSLAAIVPAIVLLASSASAGDPAACEVQHDIDKYQLLRRLSLDLRSRIPTIEEYEALDAEEDVPVETIQSYLEGDEFRRTMRQYHERLFWPNIIPAKIHDVETLLTDVKDPYAWRIYSGVRTKTMRNHANAGCSDFEQTHFDPAHPGEFRPDPAYVQVDADGVLHEGWRYVHPFWEKDPAAKLKVCAFDAQEAVNVPASGGTTVDCASIPGRKLRECGCGPGLQSCYPTGFVIDNPIKASLREQLNLLVDEVTVGGKSYTDLLLSTKAKQDGKIAFWKKHLAPSVELNITYNVPDPAEEVLDKDYLDETWTEVDRGPLHAGVLTLPIYLLRFQTNRSRGDRFRVNFMCQYFIPPEKLEPAPGCSETDSDITKRCNCQYCHQILEPLSLHFATFAEAGTTLMTDEATFPQKDITCADGTPTAFCRRFYVTQPDAHNPGVLTAYQFSDTHPDYVDIIQKGPRALAQETIDSGAFAQCAVKRVFSYFHKRDLAVVGDDTDELELLNNLATEFEGTGYDLRQLILRVVTLPQYRRIH